MSGMFGYPSPPKPRRPAPSKGITPVVGQAVMISRNKITDTDSYCSAVWEVVAVSPQACVVKPAGARIFSSLRPGPYMIWFRDHEIYDATPIIDGLLRDEREQGLLARPVHKTPEAADLRFGPEENFAKAVFEHLNGEDSE